MLTVIDTNILVSALWSRDGNPAKIVALALNGDIQICHTEAILTEYREVLCRPRFGFSENEVGTLLDYLAKSGISVTPKPLPIELPDEDDRVFYETAKFCGAVLITGNLKHFPKEPDIVSATEFLKTWGSSEL